MPMTEDQVRLLSKLQQVGISAFAAVNPLTMSEDEAGEFLRRNLPPLEWMHAEGETEQREYVEKRFLGVSENNCLDQINAWREKENITLFQNRPNPRFGSGEMWLEYFSQPMGSINFRALNKLFSRWEIPVAQIPIPEERQKIAKFKAPIPKQEIYRRLDAEDTAVELANLVSRQGLSDGVQLGFAPGDVDIFDGDTTFHTFLSPLTKLSTKERGELRQGKAVENLVGQEEVTQVHSDIGRKPYFVQLTSQEVTDEVEYFRQNGEFHDNIEIGHGTGNRSSSEKSVEPFVNELSDEELDELEAGTLSGEKLHGQKLLGYTASRDIKVFRRLTPEELAKEVERFAAGNGFSSARISIGHAADRETHQKEFHKSLVPLSPDMVLALAAGKSIHNQDLLMAQKLVCRTPAIPAVPVYETKFSALELAFDDCPEEHIEINEQHQRAIAIQEFNNVTPEQRAMIKALQAVGKSPKIERNAYLSFTSNDADKYIQENKDNPKNTYSPIVYPSRSSGKKEEAYPEIKQSNTLSRERADYLQRSVIRDLVAEGHLATPETQRELLDKLDFITADQAAGMIAEHMDKPAGPGLLNQCRAYVESGKISRAPDVETIGDACRLFQSARNRDFVMKSVLRDLIDDGYIQEKDAADKIKFTTAAQDETLIDKYGDAPVGNRLRACLQNLIDDAHIGRPEDDYFQKLTVRDTMQMIAGNTELEEFKSRKPASEAQKDLLWKMDQRGQVDLGKINLDGLSARAAHQLIDQGMNGRGQPSGNVTATFKQKEYLKVLVEAKLLRTIPYEEWKALTASKASELISSVPEEIRLNLANSRSPAAVEPTSPPKPIER